MRTLAFVLALLPSLALAQEQPPAAGTKPPAKDQVYKWVDADGVVHYSSQPPSDGARPAKLPPLQTYKGGTNPNLGKFQKPDAKGGTAVLSQVEVVTPAADETFRGGERVVPVAVLVTPALTSAQKLVYLLDGRPASQPTSNTSFALTEVDRGTHTVTVAVVDAGTGETLATSSGVVFHMKPPIAGQATPPPKPKPKTP